MLAEMALSNNALRGFPDSMPEPQNFYRGLVEPQRPRASNLIAFLRTSRDNLQQMNFANRSHHRHVLILVLETTGSVIVDGAEHVLASGQAYYVRPFQFHHYLNLTDESLRWAFLTFELDTGADAMSALSHNVLEPDDEEIQLWRSIIQYYTRPQHSERAEALPMLDRLLYRLYRKHRDRAYKPAKDSWIAQAEALVLESVQQGWTIEEVGRRMGLSGRHLRTRFHAEMGVSLREYRANYQLHCAIRLLREPHTPLGQIAELCGFNSQAVFTRFIKRQTGLTPLAFRRQLRESPTSETPSDSLAQN